MYWNWWRSAIALAAVFLIAVIVVKPIGVSTQFVILDAWVASKLNPELITESAEAKHGYSSSNAYLDKSGGKYAKSASNLVNYSFIFVIAMVAGGFIGSRTQSRKAPQLPAVHKQRFGQTPVQRYVMAFVGGVLVLWGARLAGGCTSGHMMSGMMQTSVSGYLFAAGAFAAAVPTALLLYFRKA